MTADNQPTTSEGGLSARLRAQYDRLATNGRETIVSRFLPSLRANPLLALALAFSLVTSFYWLLLASNRYVSEAHVIVQQTDLASTSGPDISSLLTGNISGNRHDQLIMRDYLLSRDVVTKMDRKLHLSDHYMRWTIDPFSRLSFANSLEDLHRYYLSRVHIEYDEYAGVLVISAEAFTPEMAQNISTFLVAEGEQFMNATAHNLASDQVSFLERQVKEMNKRAIDARQKLLDYQNREGIVSPTAQAEAIGAIIAQLEAKRTELQLALAAQRAFLVDSHPVIVELNQQISAIERQIGEENAKLAAPQGGRLNSKVEEFGRLQAQAKFAEDIYRSALIALEKGRVESTRTIKKLSVIQRPNLPDEAEQPERIRKAIIFTLLAFLIAGVAQLLIMIIKDHKD